MNQSGTSDLLDMGPNGPDGTRLGSLGANPTPQFVPSCSPVTDPLATPGLHFGSYALLVSLLMGVAAARIRST